MAYAQRYNPERDMMELYDTDTNQLVMSSPVAPLSQSVLQKYQAFPEFRPEAPKLLGNVSDQGVNPAYSYYPTTDKPPGTFSAPALAPSVPVIPPTATAQPAAASANSTVPGFGPNLGVTKGFAEMRQGALESANVAARAADEMVGIQKAYNDRIQAEQEIQKKNEQERLGKLAQMQAEYKAISDDLRSSKVDPDHFYGSRSTGQKVSIAIGLALSGIADAGAVFSGRGRTDHFDRTMGIVNAAIDRDIGLQKYAIDQKRAAAGDKLNIYNMMLRQFGDERNAEQATRLYMLEDVKNRLMETELRYKAPQVRANAKEMLGKLGVQEQQIQTELSNSILEKFAKVQEQQAKMAEGQRELYVEGAGLAPDKETARKARDALSTKDNIILGIDQLLEIRKEYGVENFPTEIAAKAKTIAADMAVQLKNLYQLGALSQSDFNLLYNVVPKDPTGYGFKAARLQTLRDLTVDKTRNIMSRYGLKGKESNVTGSGARTL